MDKLAAHPLQPTGIVDDDTKQTETQEHATDWLALAKDAYTSGSDYISGSLRRQQEKNMDAFNSKHWRGSKYFSDAYKYRSKLYRPKTRASIRRNEAAAAIAFFSTQDMVTITPHDDDNEAALNGAKVLSRLLNYRLANSIPWFVTAIGGFQDALKTGVVISKQTWQFVEGELDQPKIELIPFENFIIDPAADWTNPIKTSPYVIHKIPMRIADVMERIEKGQFKKYSKEQIQSVVTDDFDSIRRAREGRNRTDAKDSNRATTEFDIVWIHENFIKKDGKDVVFYTLGTQLMLSDPLPIEEAYLHGERPFVMGNVNIETHKMYPSSDIELSEGTQQEANDIANQRLDNVKLAMNKRYFGKRTAKVDWRSLTRNVPGSVTLMDSVGDVQVEHTPDVTSSSYAEQDRINLDFDEIVGTFSPSSVQSNRKLNETVGGMNLLSNDANSMSEYKLRIFTETWVEPVLRQIVALERHYETDEVVLGKAEAGIDGEISIGEDILLTVNVGFGATDPMKRIAKITVGIDTIAKYSPQALQALNTEELSKEVFGALGYKDGKRFFKQPDGEGEDPEKQAMAQEIQQLQQAIQQLQQGDQTKMQLEKMKIDGAIAVAEVRHDG